MGLSGPAHGLYHTLARRLGGVRVHYRKPGRLEDCLFDVLLVHNLLTRRGVERVALVGHSFGGAVAVGAGVLLGSATAGVVALSTQVPGTEAVDRLRRADPARPRRQRRRAARPLQPKRLRASDVGAQP